MGERHGERARERSRDSNGTKMKREQRRSRTAGVGTLRGWQVSAHFESQVSRAGRSQRNGHGRGRQRRGADGRDGGYAKCACEEER